MATADNGSESVEMFFKDLGKSLPKWTESVLEIAANQLNTKMKVRIFDNGNAVNGVLKNGQGYGKGYAEYRKSLGRQTAKIDLELFGDLKRSIQEKKATNGQNIIFVQQEQTDKAREIELRWKQDIFAPSKTESDFVFDLIDETFNELINETAKKYNFKTP